MASKYDKARALVAALAAAGFDRAYTTEKAPIYQRHPASVTVFGQYTDEQRQQMLAIARQLDPTAHLFAQSYEGEPDVLIDAFGWPHSEIGDMLHSNEEISDD